MRAKWQRLWHREFDKCRKRLLGRRPSRAARRQLCCERLDDRRMLTLWISEIHADPLFGSTEVDQYVEFRGTPGSTIPNGTYFVVVDGDFLNEGNIHTVFDLSGQTFGSNGYLVLLEKGNGYATDSGAKVLTSTSPGFGGLPNGMFKDDSTITDHIDFIIGANTYMLVQAPTAPTPADDVDADDNGTLDGIVSNWTVLDSVGVLNTGLGSFAYAPLVFRWFGAGTSPPGATVVEMDHRISYVARIGESTGFSAADWVAATTTERSSDSFQFRIERGVFGSPSPRVYAGRDLNHIGARNFFGAISGTVFKDLDGNGNQETAEPGLGSVVVFADRNGDSAIGEFTVHVEPDDFPERTDLTNVAPNATLTIAGSNNDMHSFIARSATVFFPQWASTGQRVFAVEGVDFLNSSSRLRVDFYRPVRAVSIDAIGTSTLSDVYGRLEAFDSSGASLGFVRSAPLRDGQVERLTVNRGNADIAWAVAYSDELHLSSSPFGKFDHLSFIQPEHSTTTSANGNYTLDLLPPATYTVRQIVPADLKQSFPTDPPGTHVKAIAATERVPDVHFGNRGNLPPSISDQTFAVLENTANGNGVATVLFSDVDTEQSIALSIVGGTGANVFAIDSVTGRITVTNSAALDFETTSSWQLIVRAVDNFNPPAERLATITIDVVDVNEPPVLPVQSFTLSENSANGTVVGTLTATDPDAGLAGDVTFSIIGGNTSAAFQVAAATGQLTVSNVDVLDFETTPNFDLLVLATDKGTPAKASSRTVQIHLQNVNEPPVIITETLEVSENTAAGTVIGNIVVNNPETAELLSYRIVGGSGANVVSVNFTNGQLTVTDAAGLDFEAEKSLHLDVEVLDNANPALSDRGLVIIQIANVNEPPNVAAHSFTIDENRSDGTLVGKILATDPDEGQQLTYAISGGSGQGIFAIGSSSGEITVAASSGVNFETNSELNLEVTVTDNGTPVRSTPATATIHLTDLNEAPSIEPQTLFVDENAAVGTVVGIVSAHDPDAGDSVTYEIIDGNGATSFEIHATSGEVKVRDSAALDREATAVLNVNVRVTDQTGHSVAAPITVQLRDQNEFAPTIASDALSIAENSANGALVGNVPVSDLDATHVFSFSLVAGNLENAFAIDPATGALRVQTPEALNHESRSTYQLTIEVADSVEPIRRTSVAIPVQITDVNEFAPAVSDHTFFTDEGLAAGTVIGVVPATDDDHSQTLRFTITNGNTDDAFRIHSASGEISINNSAAFNFEVSPVFNLDVTVSDSGEPSRTDVSAVTIRLNDVNEFAPEVPAQSFTIEEIAPFSTIVGRVTFTDLDVSQTVRVAIIDGNVGNAFSMDAATGELRVVRTAELDFETIQKFSLSISATDDGLPPRTGTGTVTVDLTDMNEFPPTVAPGTFSVDENAVPNTIVGAVSASDLDVGQALIYSITGGNSGNAFAIDATTGVIRVREATLLDFETASPWNLTVTATDSGQPALSSNGIMTISVKDVNEFAPIVQNQSFSVSEDAAFGTRIGGVVASDPDGSQTVRFAIVNGTANDAFTIDPVAGDIRVQNAAALNFEEDSDYALTIEVTDTGIPVRSARATVTILVTDVNEATPRLEQRTFHVLENVTGNPTIADLSVIDSDLIQTHTFGITGGNTQDIFQIDVATGVVTLRTGAGLDHEGTSTFDLAVQVTDNGVPPRSATESVVIVVDNVNEPPTAIAGGPYNIDVGTDLHLDASSSRDPDAGDLLRFNWDFNQDDTVDFTTTEATATAPWSTLANVGLRPGTHPIRLKVVDGAGVAAQASATVTITETFLIAAAESEEQKELTLKLSDDELEVRSRTNVLNSVAYDDVSTIKIVGSAQDNTLTVDYRSGNPIPDGGLEYDGMAGSDMFVIGGSDVHLNLTNSDEVRFKNIETLNIVGNSPNSLTLDVQSVLDATDAAHTLSVVSDGDDTIQLGSGWRIQGTTVDQGAFVRILKQDSATLRLTGPYDWSNPLIAFDVNANTTVEPLDVLIVVNELNSPRFSQPDRRLLPAPGVLSFPNFYYDAKPDGFVVPLDALTIINFLNNRSLTAEGESNQTVQNSVFESYVLVPGPIAASGTTSLPTQECRSSSITTKPDSIDPPPQSDGSMTDDNSSTSRLQRAVFQNEPVNQELLDALDLIFADASFGENR